MLKSARKKSHGCLEPLPAVPKSQYAYGEGDFMSATMMTLPIDSEIAGWLAKKAAVQGVNIEQVAVETLRQQARKPSINEEELQQDIEQVLAEVRGTESTAPPALPAKLQTFLQAMAAESANVPVLPQAANERAFYYEGQE